MKQTIPEFRRDLIDHGELLESFGRAVETRNFETCREIREKLVRSSSKIFHDETIEKMRRKLVRRRKKRSRKEEKNFEASLDVFQRIVDVEKRIERIKTVRKKNSSIGKELDELDELCREKIAEYRTELNDPKLDDYLFNNNGRSFYENDRNQEKTFLRAHSNARDLIETRFHWDRFLSGRGTFQEKWHEPSAPSDSNWSKLIFKANKKWENL